MWRHSLSERVYKCRTWIRECVLIDWNDFGVSSTVRARKPAAVAWWSRLRYRRTVVSKLDSTDDLPCMCALCALNPPLKVNCFHVGLEWNMGNVARLRYCPHQLTTVQN
ncbi:hypothetical protein AVEN_262164-1 [Araneus ventricosus]|uniref:Uncharacterized protein n=1 Tax=Araneus ventricosus TaxID=182803 RepID=A0A4Y2EK76_ARAVE|nr:hypothetical protein AVEN_262164-1 [Araneus ventricosus]